MKPLSPLLLAAVFLAGCVDCSQKNILSVVSGCSNREFVCEVVSSTCFRCGKYFFASSLKDPPLNTKCSADEIIEVSCPPNSTATICHVQ